MTRLEPLPEAVRATLAASGLDPKRFDALRADVAAGRFTDERNRVAGEVTPPVEGEIAELPTAPAERARLAERGRAALRAGEAGLVLLNGGMATRFGGEVKGAVEVAPGRSFLSLKLRDARRAAAAAGGPPPVAILMNSRATADATAAHLAASEHAGHPPGRVWSFEQRWAPRLTPGGALFRGADGAPAYYGPGHGDLVDGLEASGLLARFREAGGRVLLMSNVDNAVATLDPVILGWHLERAEAITVEVVDKNPGDTGGAPARVEGVLQIVEGFRFPHGFDQGRVPVFNTNTLWFDVEALAGAAPLTWFAVRKRVDEQPVVQLERLVGEITATVPSAFLRVPRSGPATRFVPVKTPADLEAASAALLGAWAARGDAS